MGFLYLLFAGVILLAFKGFYKTAYGLLALSLILCVLLVYLHATLELHIRL